MPRLKCMFALQNLSYFLASVFFVPLHGLCASIKNILFQLLLWLLLLLLLFYFFLLVVYFHHSSYEWRSETKKKRRREKYALIWNIWAGQLWYFMILIVLYLVRKRKRRLRENDMKQMRYKCHSNKQIHWVCLHYNTPK